MSGLTEADLSEVVYQALNAVLGVPSQESGTNSKRWDLAFEIKEAVESSGWLAAREAALREAIAQDIEALAKEWEAEADRYDEQRNDPKTAPRPADRLKCFVVVLRSNVEALRRLARGGAS